MIQRKYEQQGFYSRGYEVEEKFILQLRKQKPELKIIENERIDDSINIDWDIKIIHPNEPSKYYDVKGLKKIKRKLNQQVSYEYHWVEILNVGGTKGWLYKKKIDFFIFETEHDFLFVKKEDLQNLIKEFCVKELVQEPTPYFLYRRTGRKDCLTLIPIRDLYTIASEVMSKT